MLRLGHEVIIMNVYDFKVKAQDGSEVSLEQYKGKVLLIAPDDICGMGSLTKDMDTINALYKKGYEDAKKIEDFMNR